MTRYFLTIEREVTKEEYVAAEREAGFYPKGEDTGQPATASFGAGNVRGRTEYVDCQNIPKKDIPKGLLKDGKWGYGEYHS